jgi:hypothetical protein
MATYADLAADLLAEASNFMVRVSEGQPAMQQQMLQNAGTFRQMADLIRSAPQGQVEHLTHAEMAARLLEDAAKFFHAIAETNAPIQEQMEQNAAVFQAVAAQLRLDPVAQVPEGEQE